MIRYSVLSAQDLSPDLVETWRSIQHADPAFSSPYFCPEFTLAVAAVRRDVRVALIEDGHRVVGFFPYQRRWNGVGRPVGLALSDYHGVIVQREVEWTVADLLVGCHLARWQFDHVPAAQTQFRVATSAEAASPIVEFGAGFDAYLDTLDRAGRKQVRECERKRTRLGEDAGPLLYVADTKDVSALRHLMSWKSAKCRATGVVDFFSIRWCRELLERLLHVQSPHFGVQLATLQAGHRTLAGHLALRSASVWHSWFPAYDETMAPYSPGAILLLDVLRSAADSGAHHFDFGKDISTYKRRYMTGSIALLVGRAETPAWINRLSHWRVLIERWSTQSTMGALGQLPGRALRRLERRRRYV